MKSKIVICLLFVMLLYFPIEAQDYFELPLWSATEVIPDDEIPTIRVYHSEKPNGAVVIACPGGGYRYLEMNKEGYAFAPWFNERGITFVVLKYRLPAGNPQIPLADAKQAIRLVREHVKEWKIDPQRVGILGSSAGGHLASTLATHFDADTRPDFQILLYPVISMDTAYTHKGSFQELLGENPSREDISLYSNECQVTPQTPPAFIVLSDNDKTVASQNSVNYYLALNKNNVPSEMHIYPTGGHGWGMHKNFMYYNQWTQSLEQWLEDRLSNLK